MLKTLAAAIASTLCLMASSWAATDTDAPPAPGALAALQAFSAALQHGDADAASAWLLPGVVIYESGGAEASRQEYQAQHLAEDIAFLKTAEVKVVHQQAEEGGEVAWVITDSEIKLPGQGKTARRWVSKETAVLHKTPAGWRIAHLHWSTQKKRR